MTTAILETRVDRLEVMMAELTANVNQLSLEMRDFKDEMGDFKDEMSDFKDEMSDFKEENRRQNEAMNRRWGELANKMGTLAEDLVAPSVPRILREVVGCPDDTIEFMAVRVRGTKKGGESQEFDVVAVCGEHLLINETKTRLGPGSIDDFVALLERVREFLPEYADRKIVGALASFYVDLSLVRSGERQGLIMLGAADGVMEMLNSPGFTPRLY